MPWSATDVAPQLPKEIGVLKESKQPEVDYKTECHKQFAPPPRTCGVDDVGNQVVTASDNCQQEEINATALIVEIIAESEHKESSWQRLVP